MEIPTDRKVLQLSTSSIWISDEGILYSKPRLNAPQEQSMEQMKIEMDKLRDLIGHTKVCMVLESNTNTKPPPKEQRDFIADELNSVTKAMAIVTSSPLSRMLANLFFGFRPPAYPVKFFSNDKEATAWVRQFLTKKEN